MPLCLISTGFTLQPVDVAVCDDVQNPNCTLDLVKIETAWSEIIHLSESLAKIDFVFRGLGELRGSPIGLV